MMVELSTITEGKMQHNEIHIPETQARTDKELETGSMVVPLPPRPPKSPDSTPKHTVVMNPHEPRIPEWPQPTAKTKMQWAPTRNIEEGLHQSLKHKPKPNRGQAAHPRPQASAQNGDKLFRKASYEEDPIALLYRGSTFPVTRGADSSLQAPSSKVGVKKASVFIHGIQM